MFYLMFRTRIICVQLAPVISNQTRPVPLGHPQLACVLNYLVVMLIIVQFTQQDTLETLQL